MGDGAHLGVTAGRALGTVLGDMPQPSTEERRTQEEFAVWIRSTPMELEAVEGDDGYSNGARWLAKRYLLILEQAPAIDIDTAWEVFRTKWPEDADEAGDMTGFMHGWAWNAARHSLAKAAQPNPAILVIGQRRQLGLRRLLRHLWAKRYDWLSIRLT